MAMSELEIQEKNFPAALELVKIALQKKQHELLHSRAADILVLLKDFQGALNHYLLALR